MLASEQRMSRVLIIDDDPGITRLLEEHLSNEGYEVSSSYLAEEGFKQAITTPPELIFLDVMLPDATGFQMLGRFRQNPITKSIPIIVMSGTARYPNQQEIGKWMGANDYILKPFDVLDLGERVRRLIEARHEKPILGEPPQTVEVPDPVPEETAPTAPEPEPAAPESDAVVEEPVPFLPEQETNVAESLPFATTAGAPAPLTYEPETTLTEPHPFAPDREPEPKPEPATVSHEPAHIAPESIQLIPSLNEIETPVGQRAPTSASVPIEKKRTAARLFWVAGFILVHLILTGAGATSDSFRAIATVAGGWAMLLGLLTGACAVFRIQMESRQALRVLGWASIPIVIRAAVNLAGIIPDPSGMSNGLFWLRPLDAFEMASGVILAISFRRLPGSSIARCLLAVLSIALAWSLCARGYFRPF